MHATPSIDVPMRRQASWQFVSRGVGGLCQALLLILLARSVTPEAFGEVTVVLGVAVFVGVVADLGLSSYIVRVIAVDDDIDSARVALQINRLSSTVFVAVGGLIYLGIASALSLSMWVVLVVVWVGLEKNIEAQLAVFIAEQNVVVPALSVLVRRLLPIPIYALLITAGLAGDAAFGIAIVVGASIGMAQSSWLVRARLGSTVRGVLRPISVLKQSLPFFVTNASAQARNLDTSIVGLFASAAAAGAFAAASRLTVPIFLLTSAVATSVIPAVARGGVALAQRIVFVLLCGLVASQLLVLVTLPFAEPAMALIFGRDYDDTGYLLSLVLSGTLFTSVVAPLNALTQALGGARRSAIASSVFSGMLLFGLATGAVIDGVVGAATAALIVQFLNAGIAFLLAQNSVKLSRH